jgi:signal transduction histidine kinase
VSGDVPLVDGDRDRLSDVVYHLAQNAIKFNRPGGQVKIACQSAPEYVVVEVSDTGVGIPEAKLATMWEDFTQAADPLRRGVEGLGLGLPLVKYVVTAHGGQTWANSEEGRGSTFGFSIPIKSAHHTPQPLTVPRRDGRLGALVSKS